MLLDLILSHIIQYLQYGKRGEMDNNSKRLQEANNNVDSVIDEVWEQGEENLRKLKAKWITKQLDLSNQTGLTKEKKAILKEHMGSVSFKIDTSAVREWWKYESGCEQEIISDETELTPMADITRIAQQTMKEKGLTFEDIIELTHEAQQKYRETLDRLSKVDVKPIPKTQVGMSKRQKEIMKSFVGKYPLEISLSDVYEPEEDDMTELVKKRRYITYEE